MIIVLITTGYNDRVDTAMIRVFYEEKLAQTCVFQNRLRYGTSWRYAKIIDDGDNIKLVAPSLEEM